MADILANKLLDEVLRARTRVYHGGAATPLQSISIPELNARVYIKREDLSPINAYKWRGAFNCTAALKEKQNAQVVVAASAGNHAQGVALAARVLGMQAKIFMPLPTSLMKQRAVHLHGGTSVEIFLRGDNFDQAACEAAVYTQKHGYFYVHPFEDLHTIAGQATIADELVLSGEGPFDFVFLQIGGGGMAAGVANWLKAHDYATHMLGVEGVGQACMKASFDAGEPRTLSELETFCDGTAVTRPGDLTYSLCRNALDDILTVTNEEVCAAIQQCWESCRVIPEPSGAMGLAGLIQFAQAKPELIQGKKLLAIISGANMDFGKLSLIASQSPIGAHRRRYLRFRLPENKGGLLALVEKYFGDVSVSEFQYGKMNEMEGHPVIAFEAAPEVIEALFEKLRKHRVPFEDVTGDADVRYRIIPYNPALFKRPLFFHVNFPERSGALRDFMRSISGVASVCYFNYAYTGESIGRALMGFEFSNDKDREEFLQLVKGSVVTCRLLSENVAVRMLGN